MTETRWLSRRSRRLAVLLLAVAGVPAVTLGIFRIDAQSGEVTTVVHGPKFSASPL